MQNSSTLQRDTRGKRVVCTNAQVCVRIGVGMAGRGRRISFCEMPLCASALEKAGVGPYLREALASKCAVAGTFSRRAARNF